MTPTRSTLKKNGNGLLCATRPSKWRVLLRTAGWVVLCLYLFLATTLLALRLWVVPNIETFYPKLENYIEERTGTLIEARDIHVDWERLRPRITLTDVTFARPGHRVSLSLPKVQATFSLSSFYTLQPTFSRLVIFNPRLHVERLSETLFNIAGFEIDTSGSENTLKSNRDRADPAASSLIGFYLRSILKSLTGTSITLTLRMSVPVRSFYTTPMRFCTVI